MARAAQQDFHVIRGSRAGEQADVAIDVADAASVHAAFASAKPGFVMLFAAIADIDRCQRSPEDAYAVNLRGAQHVAEACAASGAGLLFVSTGAVFDGCKHGYSEHDPMNPVSVYGRTKARAEESVRNLVSSAIIVRIALALGFAAVPGTNAILDSLRQRLAAGEVVKLPTDEQRNPIDAATACEFMLDLTRTKAAGIFHMGSSDPISRYDLGVKLASRMGYEGRIQPLFEPVSGRAPRGPDHFLLPDKLRASSTIPIPTCDQVIARCFDGFTQS